MKFLNDNEIALQLLNRAEKAELTVEVVMSALNHMQNDPTLSEINALALAIEDWDC